MKLQKKETFKSFLLQFSSIWLSVSWISYISVSPEKAVSINT